MPHSYKAVYQNHEDGQLHMIKFVSELFFGFEDHLAPCLDLNLQREVDKKASPSAETTYTLVKVEYIGFRMQDDRHSCIGHLLSVPLKADPIWEEEEEESEEPLRPARLRKAKKALVYEELESDEQVGSEYGTKTIRILLAIEHPDLLATVSSLLIPYPHIRVVSKATNVIVMFNQIQKLRPDVLVAQFFSPAMAGADTLRYMLQHFPPLPILSIGTEMTRSTMRRFFIKGALGETITQEELCLAITSVSEGKVYSQKEKKESKPKEELVMAE